LAHLILTSVGRRRRELGVLRALGFTRRQTVATILSMAVVLAVAMLLIGVPLGIVAGRLVWAAVADHLGAVAGARVPILVLTVVPATLVAALGAALWPAWRAVSRLLAGALRTE
jgi:ABC-type antimicrobial peptide transport system permease subunit